MGFQLTSTFSQAQIDGDPARTFDTVAVGSESVGPNTLFILIEQQYMNNWRHLASVVGQGVGSVVGLGPRPDLMKGHPEITWVSVADPAAALLRVGLLLRDASAAKRIAVTGSNGKTSTKDLITHLLRLVYKRTLKSFHNYNGELGVPLTLRKMRSDDQFLVAEVGMGDPGSVRRRASWVSPHVAVITNVGESHLLRFSSRQAIAEEKGEVLRALLPGGLAVLNGDDDQCRRLAATISQPVVFFGLGADCDFRAVDIHQGISGLSFQLLHAGREYAVSLPLFGRYQVENALAAFAVADWAGIDLTTAAARLASFKGAEQRGKVFRVGGTMIIDDAYNSNPWSVQQAVSALAELPIATCWLVLGDMQPLGPEREAPVHAELARWLSTVPLKGIALIGPEIERIVPDYHGEALLHYFRDDPSLVKFLLEHLPEDSAVLLKGQDDRLFSRIADQLKTELSAKHELFL